jgi:RNA polymerase sigma factor (sigma-70 family)
MRRRAPVLSSSTDDLPARAAAGEPGAMEELVAAHTGMVRVIARKWASGLPPMLEEADLVQEGFLALLDCPATFDPDRGVPFHSYAWLAITRAVCEARRLAARGCPRRWQLPDTEEAPVLFPDDGAGSRIAPSIDEVDRRVASRELLDRLPASTRKILMLRFGFAGRPHSYAEIARAMRCCKESCRVAARGGLELLAAAWTQKGEE